MYLYVIIYMYFQTNVTRARWYDLPFTRMESLTADKKFTLFGKKYNVYKYSYEYIQCIYSHRLCDILSKLIH